MSLGVWVCGCVFYDLSMKPVSFGAPEMETGPQGIILITVGAEVCVCVFWKGAGGQESLGHMAWGQTP